MAIKKVIDIEVNDNLNETQKHFDKMLEAIEESKKATEQLNENVKGLSKATKSAESGMKKIGSAVKGLGTAMKALGIGLIVSAFTSLKEIFTQNQKVADTINAVFETMSIVFNEVARVVTDVYDRVSKATGGFDALKKVIGGVITIALAPLKAAFYGVKLGVQEVQLIWEKSFFGDKDQKTIKNLQKEIKATQKDIKGVGTEVIQAGKDIGKNFVEAVGEVGSLVTETAKGISDISVKAAYDQAKLNVEIQNQAKIAAAQQALLVEKYDRQAEKLRQVRDEERNTIDERIKANDKLKDVLDKQEKAMLRQADLQVQAAKNELAKSNSIENRVALLDAQANREGILAQIEGFRSEQLANDLALSREKIELTQTKLEAETALAIEQKKFNADLIKDDQQRLIEQRRILEEEKKIELERLQSKIDSYNEGTQARLEAEIEYATKKQEIDNESKTLEDELSTYRIEKANKEALAKAELNTIIEKNSLQSQIEFLQVQRDIELQNTELTESEKALIKERYREKELQAKLEIENAKFDTAKNALGVLSGIEELFANKSIATQKRAFKVKKAADLASATLDGYRAVLSTYAQTPGGPVLKGIAAGVAGGFAALQIAKISQSKFNGGEATGGGSDFGGGSVNAPSESRAPQFNIVGQGGVGQAQFLEQKPVQAFVVSGEVTSQQALDRNRLRNATL